MRVIITGGGSGLGRSVVERFSLDTNNSVLFTYYQTEPGYLEKLSLKGTVTAIKCDFSSDKDLAVLSEEAKKFEADLLINNSWLNLTRQHFHRFEREEIAKSFNSNIAPMIELSRHILKSFKKRRSGKVINILSSAIIGKPPVGMSIYAAEKAYIMQLSKGWVSEFGSFGVAINNVLPGFMNTSMNADMDDRIIAQIKDSMPNGELLTTEELAQTVYLLANMPRQVTGNNIVVNSGETLST